MAESLVESLAADFEPAKYHDEYREQVMALIRMKADGEEFEMPEVATEKPKVIDIMAALEASVKAAKDARSPPSVRAGCGQEAEQSGDEGGRQSRRAEEGRGEEVRLSGVVRERSSTWHAPVVVEIDGRTVSLSNLDKVLYPSGFTKAEVVDYHARIAPYVIPHLAGRCLTFRRFPNGTDEKGFFEKRCPSHRPEWVPVALGPGDRSGGIEYCRIEEPAAMVWAANMAAIEIARPDGPRRRSRHAAHAGVRLRPGPEDVDRRVLHRRARGA